jgi:hypothetical protein
MNKGVPSYVHFLNLHYIVKGAINKRLGEKALIKMLVLSYNELLVIITKIINLKVIKISLTKQWQRLRVYRV